MRRFPRVAIAAALSASVLAAVAGCSAAGPASTQAAKPTSYVLGAALPLSGAALTVGQNFQQGAQIAIDEINAAGGIDGVPVQIQFQDNLTTADGAISALNALRAQYGVKASIMTTGAGVAATAPLAERDNLLLLNPGTSDPSIVGLSRYLFSNIVSLNGELNAMLPYLSQQGFKNMVIYGQKDSLGEGAVSAIQPIWTKLGGTVLDSELEDQQATDHSAVIARIKTFNPDVVYIAANNRQAATFIQQANALLPGVQLVGYSGLQSGQLFQIAGDTANGVLASAPSIDVTKDTPANDTYVAEYKKANPTGDPSNPYAILAYNAVKIWQAAIEWINKQGLDYSAENLRNAILAIKTFDTAGGTTVFSDDGTSTSAITLSKIQDQKFVPFQVVQPGS